MSLSKYPASMTKDDVKHRCPVFGDGVCPFSKLPEEQKGVASKCPAFQHGCPFKGCQSVGDTEDMMGQMRDKCKGGAAQVEFFTALHRTAQQKAVDVGASCPVFKTKGGCPFATDIKGKPVFASEYVAGSPWNTPWGVTLDDIMISKCPAFGKGVCPYTGLVAKSRGLAHNCPAFKGGCPFKGCKSVGEFVEKMSQMGEHCKGKQQMKQFFEMVKSHSQKEEKKLGKCTFINPGCPFVHDAAGKRIIPK